MKNAFTKNAIKILSISVFIFICGATFTSMAKNKDSDLVTITGTIRYQGNVPFQYPCVKTEDGKIYTILADEKTLTKITQNALSTFQFDGKIIPNNPKKLSFNGSKDGYLEIQNFRILKTDKRD